MVAYDTAGRFSVRAHVADRQTAVLGKPMRPYPNVPVGMRLTDRELHESLGGWWAAEKTVQLVALKEKGFTWAEIATEMNMSCGGVRKKYYRIRDEVER